VAARVASIALLAPLEDSLHLPVPKKSRMSK
jgi:hypothetical protein